MNADFIRTYHFDDPAIEAEWQDKAPRWLSAFQAWFIKAREPRQSGAKWLHERIEFYIDIGDKLDFVEPELKAMYDIAWGREFVKFREPLENGKMMAIEECNYRTAEKVAPVTYLLGMAKNLRETARQDTKNQSLFRQYSQ